MNKTIEGKSNIKATVICDSVSSVNGKRLTTFEIEVPRIVWAEFLTHRMISRNAASSRAIPFERMVDNLRGIPARFGQANPGMQDKGVDHTAEISGPCYSSDNPEDAWNDAKEDAIAHAKAFYEAGYHKQVYNRLTEPYQLIKAIATSSEWNNFFWLRDDEAADPTIQELARCMRQAMDDSEPTVLRPGWWHLPYVEWMYAYECGEEFQLFERINGGIRNEVEINLEQAIKVSAARCAAVSFRNEDYGLEKCLQVYDRLVGGERKHSSALEHQATPMEDDGGGFNYSKEYPQSWPKGFTHMDKDGNMWSGNFQNWVQYRQLIPNESKRG